MAGKWGEGDTRTAETHGQLKDMAFLSEVTKFFLQLCCLTTL